MTLDAGSNWIDDRASTKNDHPSAPEPSYFSRILSVSLSAGFRIQLRFGGNLRTALIMIRQLGTSICVAGEARPQHARRASIFCRSVGRVLAWSTVCIFIAGCLSAAAQVQPSEDASATSPPTTAAKTFDFPRPRVDLKSLPRNLVLDQKQFWTTPFHMKAAEWQWTIPVAFATAGSLASDTALEKHVATNPTTVSRALTISNAGLATMVGAGAGIFVLGHLTHDDQKRETGLLSGEAAIDAYLDTEIFKYTFERERPFTGDGRGRFFQGGSSFPSQHAAIDWAIASVIAHEYPGPMTQFLAYGAATAFSAARIVGHQHFPTDVLVGSALGWYMGRQVFRSHSHYSDAEIARWGTFQKKEGADVSPDPGNMGSVYVPLDSWIYPAMERLAALGYLQSADLGMRPWTRIECARLLLRETDERLEAENERDSIPQKIYAALEAEFRDEVGLLKGDSNLGVSLDSVYNRFTGISGLPLNDGFHFGQTIINDYGRPYGEGFNSVTGLSGHAVAGPLSVYVRGEFQHAPSVAALSAPSASVIQAVDGLPSTPPTTPFPAINRFDLLEGYVGMQLNNWQFTFGKQSLWWGEDASGPMLFSTNSAPILMLQINRVRPIELPGLLSVIGPIRLDYIVGRLTGYHWVFGATPGFTGSWTQTLSDQPFIVGQKLSFKPSPNLEIGFSATAMFGGPGVPATSHKLLQAMFSTGNGVPGSSGDAGDRRGGFDFAYRIPKLRDWATFYADAFTDDEPNPWLAWNKTALTSGVYLSQIPKIPKLDLRVEGVFTDLPGGGPVVQHGFFYNNDRFRSGYTNDGNLIGSWIGRQGQGAQAWTSYWFSPKSKVQFNFRHQKVSAQFIPGGGSLSDFGVSTDYWVHSSLELSASVQHERWLFPIIQPNVSRNITAAVQISFAPRQLFGHTRSPINP